MNISNKSTKCMSVIPLKALIEGISVSVNVTFTGYEATICNCTKVGIGFEAF